MWYRLSDLLIDPQTGWLIADSSAASEYDDENPTAFEPCSRPAFIPQMRWSVLERAKDEQGHVRCQCCRQPIREDQVVTIHHQIPWSQLKRELAANPEYRVLDDESKYRWRSEVFNDVQGHGENLVPMHVSCHFEHDTGKRIESEEQRALMDAGLPVRVAKQRREKPEHYVPDAQEQKQLYESAVMKQLRSRYMMPDGIVFPETTRQHEANIQLIRRMQKGVLPDAYEKRSPVFTELWQLRMSLERVRQDWVEWQQRKMPSVMQAGAGYALEYQMQQTQDNRANAVGRTR